MNREAHMKQNTTVTLPTEREIIISRVFAASRAIVWQAWTDPAHVMQWWGPTGFENQSCELDLRVGGSFRLSMRGPDNNVYPCTGTFSEIVEHERIVYEGIADDGHACGAGLPPRATVTVSFEPHDLGTKLTIHTLLPSAEARAAARDGGYVEGWMGALDRLQAEIY